MLYRDSCQRPPPKEAVGDIREKPGASAELDHIQVSREHFALSTDLDIIQQGALLGVEVFERDSGARLQVTLQEFPSISIRHLFGGGGSG